MKQIIYISILFLSAISISMAQSRHQRSQSEPILITGATAHLGNGEVIENAVMVLTRVK